MRMTDEEYEIKMKQLDTIQALTGINMDFQRGLLKVEKNPEGIYIVPGKIDSVVEYTEYHAGIEFGKLKYGKKLIKKL